MINAFDMPARQAFVVEMVDSRADLPNAIALNSSMVNAARLLGPSIGGIVIAAVGEGWCFFGDAVSYLAVIASLLLMRLPRRERRVRAGAPILPELRAGWSYIASSPPIASLLLLLALVSLVGMPYTVLMPIFASQILHGGRTPWVSSWGRPGWERSSERFTWPPGSRSSASARSSRRPPPSSASGSSASPAAVAAGGRGADL